MRDVIVKIAIVDDTLSNLLIVRKHVELLGHTAVTARDGGEAVRRGRLAHRAQDLVLVAADERGDGRAAAGEVDAVRAGGARAEVLDLSTMSCKQFVESGDDMIKLVLIWMDGWYKGDSDEAIIDTDVFTQNAKKFGSYCALNPTVSIVNAAEKVLGK